MIAKQMIGNILNMMAVDCFRRNFLIKTPFCSIYLHAILNVAMLCQHYTTNIFLLFEVE